MRSCPPSRRCCRRRHPLNSCRCSAPTWRSSGSRTRTTPKTWNIYRWIVLEGCHHHVNHASHTAKLPLYLLLDPLKQEARTTDITAKLRSDHKVNRIKDHYKQDDHKLGPARERDAVCDGPAEAVSTACQTECTAPNSVSFEIPHSFQSDNFWLVINPGSFENAHYFLNIWLADALVNIISPTMSNLTISL